MRFKREIRLVVCWIRVLTDLQYGPMLTELGNGVREEDFGGLLGADRQRPGRDRFSIHDQLDRHVFGDL